jgi:hypothetical protein
MDESDDLACEQASEMHHHAEGGGWVKYAALLAALLAAVAAISSSLASLRLTESSRAQVQANDQWSLYQAKSIKSTIIHTKVDLLLTLGKQASVQDAQKVVQYESDLEKTKQAAEEREAASESNLRIHEVMERGVTFFHIAIAMIAICLLTKRRLFFIVSLALGGCGVFFFVHGLLLHVR